MKILVFSWRGPGHPNAGGAEKVTHEHAKSWVQAGHDVTLFTSGFPGVPSHELIDGVEIVRGGHQIGLFHITAVFWYLFQKETTYDVIIDQFHGIPVFTPLFVRGQKVGFIHEVAKEVWWTNHLRFPLNHLYGALGYFIEPFIFRLYTKIPFVTVSLSTKADLIDWGIDKKNISIIYNGVSVKKSNQKKSKTKTLMYLGAIAKDKGIEDALKLFSLIHKSYPAWKLWIVGKGEPHYLDELNIPRYIKNYGFVDEQTKFDLLSRAHILINPSIREGWGLVNIEANAMGTPVVAYDVPGCRDSIKNNHTGILCPKGNIDQMTSQAVLLLQDDKRYKNMTTQAKNWSKNFIWEKSSTQSLKFLMALIQLQS
ncbi:MAG: glycosyltransferase family 4 protein [Patescibacteria group bacterium]